VGHNIVVRTKVKWVDTPGINIYQNYISLWNNNQKGYSQSGLPHFNWSSESYIYPRQGSHVLQSVCCIFTVQQIIRVLHLPEARITCPTKCLLYIYCTTDHQSLTSTRGKDHTSYKVSVVYLLYNSNNFAVHRNNIALTILLSIKFVKNK
jgi:hypothetical protein